MTITLEQTVQFYEILRGGDLPDGWKMSDQPSLSAEEAFSVVYLCQELLHIIPDHYEKCDVCQELFDSSHGGFFIDSDTELDEFYAGLNISLEMIRKAAGTHFCSQECEIKFWQDVYRKLS